MELFFNELSLKNKDCMDFDSVTAIVRVYQELLKHNVTTCRIAAEDNVRLFQMIGSMPDSRNVRNFYFSFFKSPYESDAVEENQDDYYEHSWSYNGEGCIGFALAFLLDSAGFGIYHPDWNVPFIEILRDGDSKNVRNICVGDHVALHLLQMRNKEDIELLKCELPISDKKIVLRNDHGMDVLEDFAKRLIRSPYLIGVVNSMPYNPYERKFIKKVRDNGLIEVVLPWTDEGYGIVVKTTGRTIRETQRIAEMIEDEFGYI